MSLKKTILFDLNLLSGSSDLLRNTVFGYYEDNNGIVFTDSRRTNIGGISRIESKEGYVNKSTYLNTLTYPVRIVGYSDIFTSDEEWRAYLIGGAFADKQYLGLYTTNVYGDHAVNDDYLPYKPSEVERNATGLSPSIVLTTEYFQNYSRYQSYANSLESELMLPNVYNLKDNYFLISNSSTGFASFEQFQYDFIKQYLNNTFTNEEVSNNVSNKNIFILNPLDTVDSKKHDLLKSNSNYIKSEDDLSKIYSLMPFANKLQISRELSQFNSENLFKEAIQNNQYEYKFLKLLKETFQNEISLSPATVNFGLSVSNYSIDYEAGTATETTSSTNIPLRLVDVPTMLLYGFRNAVAETTDVSVINSSSYADWITPFEDTSGTYRHIASDRSLDVLNSFKSIINTNFDTTDIDSIADFLNKAGDTKYHETVAFRIQKIGGPPTGDNRTENTIQNIWFYSRNEAIRYIDTQVKYDTEYTYKVFSYVLLQGYKYQTTGLVATRKIAEEGDMNCLEFYDPYTGQTSPQLASEENLRSYFDYIEENERQINVLLNRLPRLPGLYETFLSNLTEPERGAIDSSSISLELGDSFVGARKTKIHKQFSDFVLNETDSSSTIESKKMIMQEVIRHITVNVLPKVRSYSQQTLFNFSFEDGLGDTTYIDPATGEIKTSPSTSGIEIPSDDFIISKTAFLKLEEYLESLKENILSILESDKLEQILSLIETNEGYRADISANITPANALATNAQISTKSRYFADFNLTIEPSVKIVEIPLEEKIMRIVDHPPNDFNVSPYHLQDQSNRLAFYLKYDTFSADTEPYPNTITATDERNEASYKEGKDFVPGSLTKEESVSAARFIEVYRMMEKPTSYQSFENSLRTTIDLKSEAGDIASDHFFIERVRENVKYYYTFRAVNENGVAGQLSPIFESELINDGGYVYGLFNQLSEDELVEPPPKSPILAIKNLLNVVPNIQHLQLDTSGADFTNNSVDEIGLVELGTGEGFWNEKFKIRLTSKKTGRKLDLNLTFEKKQK